MSSSKNAPSKPAEADKVITQFSAALKNVIATRRPAGKAISRPKRRALRKASA